MPSPRSVLIDIHEKNLDPKLSHQVDKHGKLYAPKTSDSDVEQSVLKELIVKETPKVLVQKPKKEDKASQKPKKPKKEDD